MSPTAMSLPTMSRTTMSLRHLACGCLLIVLSWCPTLAEEAPLVWKFSVGDAHHYRLVQNMDMVMTLGTDGRQIETGVEQTLDITWKINKVSDRGVATIMQTIDRVQITMQAPGQPEMHYDTDSDDPPVGFAAMMVPLFKAMTSEPLKMTMTARGEIQNLEMPPTLSKAMQSVPGAAMMGEMFSDEGLQRMIQQNSLILPEPKDLAPGYEWTNMANMKNAQFGELKTVTTYHYLGPREVDGKSQEVFSFSLNLDFGEVPSGVEMDVVNQESSGEIVFSRAAGRLESSKLQQDMDMNISAAGQAMTQKLVQTMVFERVENQPAE